MGPPPSDDVKIGTCDIKVVYAYTRAPKYRSVLCRSEYLTSNMFIGFIGYLC